MAKVTSRRKFLFKVPEGSESVMVATVAAGGRHWCRNVTAPR